jgi:tetratricopeptide (TPR) repeat protein
MPIQMPSPEEQKKDAEKQQHQRAQNLVDESLAEIEKGSVDSEVYLRLSAGYMGLQQWDDAAKALASVPNPGTRHGQGWANLALGYRESEKPDKAVDAARRALDLAPRNLTAMVNLGLALVELGRLTEAVPTLEKVLLIQKNHPLALVGLIEAHRQLGNVDESAAYRKQAADAGVRIV